MGLSNKEARRLPRSFVMNMAGGLTNRPRWQEATQKVSSGYAGPIIYAAGDSWFCYPRQLLERHFPNAPSDLIEQLGARYAIFSEAEPANLATRIRSFSHVEGMLIDKLAETRADILLLSAGGNDLFGDGRLREILAGGNRDVSDYTRTEAFNKAFLGAAHAIHQMVDQIVRRYPRIHVLIHGYYYAVPNGNGPWLQEPMDQLGIPRQKQIRILKGITDEFNNKLRFISRKINAKFDRTSVHHIELRKVTKHSVKWYDELHPTTAGYAALTKPFIDRIDSLHPPR